jgi:hypothetical protein
MARQLFSQRGLMESDRENSRHAVGRLVIQFRIERASRRVGWVAVVTFVVALVLGVLSVVKF